MAGRQGFNKTSRSLGPTLADCHFCLVLLAKGNPHASPDSRDGKTEFLTGIAANFLNTGYRFRKQWRVGLLVINQAHTQ
jgi:hypothetical protein